MSVKKARKIAWMKQDPDTVPALPLFFSPRKRRPSSASEPRELPSVMKNLSRYILLLVDLTLVVLFCLRPDTSLPVLLGAVALVWALILAEWAIQRAAPDATSIRIPTFGDMDVNKRAAVLGIYVVLAGFVYLLTQHGPLPIALPPEQTSGSLPAE
jgi:Na+/H+ antiporter NhaD/arsenite permease-like protein